MIYKEFDISALPHLVVKDSPLFVGCEFEIENILDHGCVGDIVGITEDGSLRNNGHEYITKPITVNDAISQFKWLHDNLRYGDQAFTERTSIHVHVNCCNLFPQEVRNIVLLYALFEESFFAMVDQQRRNNIHCVALTETFIPTLYKSSAQNMVARWHKYTALNLKPISSQGTMEFRHMQGHNDTQLFSDWLIVLENLFNHGRTFKVTSHGLEEKALEKLFLQLFGHTKIAKDWANQRATMDNQIIDVKLSTF